MSRHPMGQGRPRPGQVGGSVPVVHPHMRGAHLNLSRVLRDLVGSSPRAWGSLLQLPEDLHDFDATAAALVVWDTFLSSGPEHRTAAGLGRDEHHARALVAFWDGCHDIGKLNPSVPRTGPPRPVGLPPRSASWGQGRPHLRSLTNGSPRRWALSVTKTSDRRRFQHGTLTAASLLPDAASVCRTTGPQPTQAKPRSPMATACST